MVYERKVQCQSYEMHKADIQQIIIINNNSAIFHIII